MSQDSATDLSDRHASLRAASIVAAQHLMKNEAVLFRATRGDGAESLARHELVYVLHVGAGLSLNRVAKALKRDRSTISYAVRMVEESLDDAGRAVRMERLVTLAKEAIELGAMHDRVLEELIERERSR